MEKIADVVSRWERFYRMITDENDPQMIRAHQDLLRRLGKVLGDGRQELTKPFLDRMFEVIKNHKAEYRNKGVDFPTLVVLVVPRLGIVEFVRADLDLPSISTKIVNFARSNPGVSMSEIVQAFRMAFPDLKPDDVLSEHQRAVQAAQRQIERAARAVAETIGDDAEDPDSRSIN